ncbi:C-terminal helicase domain-containing protein, partial [uncultured Corynebacterium sp.]
VNQFMHDPVTHSTAPVEAAVDTMEHHLIFIGTREARNDVVLRLGARKGKTIMFMRTKHGVDRQAKKLRRVGINALPLHGDKGQGSRTKAIEGFADGSVPVLVATDIAARGIDIADVSLVVHVDPPAEHKAYLHRSGRTARGGDSGTVVTLVTDEQRDEVAKLIAKAGVAHTDLDISDRANPASSPELAQMTGARKPKGEPLGPPHQQPSKKKPQSQSERQPSRRRSGSRNQRRRRGNAGQR